MRIHITTLLSNLRPANLRPAKLTRQINRNKLRNAPVLLNRTAAPGSSKHSDPLTPVDPQPAFAALVDRNSRFLYRVAFSLLGNRQDAEDAVQETFMKLLRTNALRPNGTEGIQDERAYLARAVWRSGLDRLTSAPARAMRHAEDIADLNLASETTSPEQHAVDASDRDLMRRLIAGLPEDLRQPLILSAIEEMRPSVVAATLGIPEATVRTRIHRAKAELRRRFEALTARPASALEARP